MWPARFAETMLQRFVRSFEKEHKHAEPGGPQRRQLLSEISEESSFADVDYEGRALNSFFSSPRVSELD